VTSPSLIAATASSLAVIVAVVSNILTIRQWRRTRYLSAAAELVHTIQTIQFTQGIAKVMNLRSDADPAAIDPETSQAIQHVAHVFESLGVLVFHRLLPLHLVDHLLGGYVRASWKRTRRYVENRRTVFDVMYGEWFQWLAERLDEHPAPGKSENAAIVHKKWKP
jgi:hypothetical protein